MRLTLATLRRGPAALVGVLVALIAAAAMATVITSLVGTAVTLTSPVHRLAGAPVVVIGDQHVYFTSGSGDKQDTEALPLPTYRPLPGALPGALAHTRGVAGVVTDVSVPTSLQAGSRSVELIGHGWDSAALTPFRLTAGHAPAVPREVVLTPTTAARLHVAIGDRVRLGGRDTAPFTVAGLAAAPPGNPAGAAAAFFSDAVAGQLSGHPGHADLIGLFVRSGADTAAVAAAVRATAGPHVSVLTGAARGAAENIAMAGDRDNLSAFSLGAGIPLVMVGLFVVAGTVGLSVGGRRRTIALVRAVGATPGQVRRALAGELAVLGLAGGILGYPLGVLLSRWAVRGLADHGLLPAGTHGWMAGWVLAVVCGAGVVVAELAGLVTGWRAGRTHPALALREAAIERTRPNLLRLVLGLAALGGGVALTVVTYSQAQNPADELNLALGTLFTFVAATALLGPVLVALAELMLRLPARAFGGVGARLALADIRRRPRRVATAVVAVALSVGFLGTVYLVNATALHADKTQNRDRLVADSVLTADGGLGPSSVAAVDARSGVRAAVGTASTTVFLQQQGGTSSGGVGLVGDDVPAVLDLDVVAGRLYRIGPGQIALSRLAAGNTPIGSTVHAFLADGTPYPATLVAVYARGLGFGDAVVPFAAAGGGHLGTTTLDQVLVRGRLNHPGALAARYPGLVEQSRSVANSAAEKLDEQDDYINGLIVTLIGLLAAVTLVNSLISATVDRRDALLLLDRVGATRAQVMAMACWQAATVAAVGLAVGIGTGAAALIAATKALTGDWHPYLPAAGTLGIGAGVLALTAAAILVPTATILRRGGPGRPLPAPRPRTASAVAARGA